MKRQIQQRSEKPLIWLNGRDSLIKRILIITLNETILNVFRNLPNNYITVDDKDPVWMNEIIKSKMKAKNKLYKQYIKNRRSESHFAFIESLVHEINDLVSNDKNLYYDNLAKKLNNPLLQTYWSILKTFYNDKKFL